MKVKSFFKLTSDLITDAFGGVLASECTDLCRRFSKAIGNVNQAEFFLSHDSAEILEARVGDFHGGILFVLTLKVNFPVGIDKNNLKG